MCVGLTLGGDDLINIPACKANLLHSEGCSYHGATHEGDIADWAGGVEIFTPPPTRLLPTPSIATAERDTCKHMQMKTTVHYSAHTCMQIQYQCQSLVVNAGSMSNVWLTGLILALGRDERGP